LDICINGKQDSLWPLCINWKMSCCTLGQVKTSVFIILPHEFKDGSFATHLQVKINAMSCHTSGWVRRILSLFWEII